MENTNQELERIQAELLAEEDITPVEEDVTLAGEDVSLAEEDVSLDDILADAELNEILREEPTPAFDDPEKIHDPKDPLVYQNFANDYGAQEIEAAAEIQKKDDTIIMALMITASVLCLGILGILGYWLSVLL